MEIDFALKILAFNDIGYQVVFEQITGDMGGMEEGQEGQEQQGEDGEEFGVDYDELGNDDFEDDLDDENAVVNEFDDLDDGLDGDFDDFDDL